MSAALLKDLPSLVHCQEVIASLTSPTHQILTFCSFFLLFHQQPRQKPMHFGWGCGVLVLIFCFGLLRKNSNVIISYAAYCMHENEI